MNETQEQIRQVFKAAKQLAKKLNSNSSLADLVFIEDKLTTLASKQVRTGPVGKGT